MHVACAHTHLHVVCAHVHACKCVICLHVACIHVCDMCLCMRVFEGSKVKNRRTRVYILECTLPGKTNKEAFPGIVKRLSRNQGSGAANLSSRAAGGAAEGGAWLPGRAGGEGACGEGAVSCGTGRAGFFPAAPRASHTRCFSVTESAELGAACSGRGRRRREQVRGGTGRVTGRCRPPPGTHGWAGARVSVTERQRSG